MGWQSSLGSISHNFAENPICDLPASSDLWDFQKAVDPTSATFTVSLEETIEKSAEYQPQPSSSSALVPRVRQMPPLTTPEKLPSAQSLLHFNMSGGVHNQGNLMLSRILDDDWSF